MKYIVAILALLHVVLSQDTSTTVRPAYRDNNVNGVNAGNMNGFADPGNLNPAVNMNPGNMNPGNMYPGNMNPGNMYPGNLHPNNADGMAVNNYPRADGGGSTTVIPGVGINAVGQVGATAGMAIGGGDSSSSEESTLELPEPDLSSVGGGAAMEEGDTPDAADGAAVNANANAAGGGFNMGGRGDFNEVGDTPDNTQNIVDADMGEQVGATSTGATAGILIAVVAVVAAGAGVGLYVIKQRRNAYSSSNV